METNSVYVAAALYYSKNEMGRLPLNYTFFFHITSVQHRKGNKHLSVGLEIECPWTHFMPLTVCIKEYILGYASRCDLG